MSEDEPHDLFEAFASGGKSVSALGVQIADLEAARKRNFRTTLAISVVMGLGLIVLSGLFVVVERSASDIRSCVTPTGICYQQQQARADKAQAQLNKVANNNRYFTLVTVECQLGDPTVAEFEACVAKKVGTAIYPTAPK